MPSRVVTSSYAAPVQSSGYVSSRSAQYEAAPLAQPDVDMPVYAGRPPPSGVPPGPWPLTCAGFSPPSIPPVPPPTTFALESFGAPMAFAGEKQASQMGSGI